MITTIKDAFLALPFTGRLRQMPSPRPLDAAWLYMIDCTGQVCVCAESCAFYENENKFIETKKEKESE